MRSKNQLTQIVPPEADATTSRSGAGHPTHNPTHDPRERPGLNSMGLLFARVGWFMVGPMAMLLTLYGIANVGSGWATALDGLFFVFLAVTIGCRWVEMRSGQATDIYGQPATWAQFWRYVTVLLPLAAGVWIVANVLGNHFLNISTLQQRGPDAPVAEAAQCDFQMVDSYEILAPVLGRLEDGRCHALPVSHNGRLVGLLTMDNVGEFLAIQAASTFTRLSA
jgi:hypothetical protein